MKIITWKPKRTALLALALAAAMIGYIAAYPSMAGAYATDKPLPIYCVDTDQKTCAISFDAAWGNEDTQTLIDILERYRVKATFFVVGDWAVKYPESVKALADAGHEVMSHSAHHDHYNQLSAQQCTFLLRNHVYTDWRDVTPTIDIPTLVIAAKNSHVKVANNEWTHAHIAGSQYKLFETAHMMFMEEPEAFNAAVAEFIG